ncbi:MAG: hypothetical protein ABI634_14710 [Acidobacteriota bacterium]
MRYTILILCTVAAALSPATVFAQAGLPGPLVDIGVDASFGTQGGPTARALSPRLTLNFTPDLALTARADAVVTTAGPIPSRVRSQRFVVEVHRTFANIGPLAVEGIVGGGLHRGQFTVPADGPRSGSPAIDQPTRVVTSLGPALMLGVGFAQRVGPHLLLRQDFRFAIHDDGPDAVVSIGVAAPLGRYTTRGRGQVAQVGTGTVRTGQRVWITTDDGAAVEGIVGDIDSRSIEVLHKTGRTAIDLARARRIEVPDSIRDGVRNGAIIGAVGMGVYGAFLARSLCECDDQTAVFVTLAIAGYGAGTGVLVGALSDGLHAGRRTILDRSTVARVTITPVFTRSHAGVAAAIRW